MTHQPSPPPPVPHSALGSTDSDASAHGTPTPPHAGEKNRRRFLPWAVGLGCAGALLVAALIVALVLWGLPALKAQGDTHEGARTTAKQASASPTPSEAPTPPGMRGHGTKRYTFLVPERWKKPQAKTANLDTDSTTFDDVTLVGFEQTSDPIAREMFSYTYQGSGQAPSTTPVSVSELESRYDTVVTNLTSGSEEEHVRYFMNVGHGCSHDFRFVTEPEKIHVDGMPAVSIEYTCTSSNFGNLGLKGRAVIWTDEMGDFHTLAYTTDEQNFDEKKAEIDALVASVKKQ